MRLQSRDGEDYLEIDSTQLTDGVLLQVGKSAEDREKLLERFREIFIGFMIPVVALGIAGGSFLAFRALRPIRSLVNTIRSVSTSRMDARVPARQTGDELDELVVLFNAMLEKIETLIKEMRGSLDNVAHDLRTPLARLHNSAETALRSDLTPETYREALADCLEESDWILTMLNTMMDISEDETGTMKLQLEVVNIPALLEDTVKLYRHVAENKGITISASALPDLRLTADHNRLRQVLANLLDNAIKYTPPGGSVSLSAFEKAGQAVIIVEDTGVGIPQEETSRIWERLYRVDKSRSHFLYASARSWASNAAAYDSSVFDTVSNLAVLDATACCKGLGVSRSCPPFDCAITRAAAKQTQPLKSNPTRFKVSLLFFILVLLYIRVVAEGVCHTDKRQKLATGMLEHLEIARRNHPSTVKRKSENEGSPRTLTEPFMNITCVKGWLMSAGS